MAKRINAKLVLELLGKGMSAREIYRTRHISQQSVKKVREAAEARGIAWEDVAGMNEADVYDLLFPEQAEAKAAVAEVDYDYVHSELQKVGVNQKLLWEEYRDGAEAEGLACVSYGTFCRGYKGYVVARNVTNHLDHKPGQVMEVDWSGPTMRLTDPFTGEVTKAYLFVATLPYSQYSYVEATLDMRQNTWLMCHVHAYDFFGGVAVRCVCDNLRTGFEICDWVYGRVVNLDFHVVFEKNRYSVPHQHVGSKADLRVTANTVEVHVGGQRVASHLRLPSYVQYRYQTDPSHMPPQFVKAEWDERRILSWAGDIGPSTYAVCVKIFASVQVKEQAYNPALAVLNLTRRYTEAELEEACAFALSKVGSPRCKFIKTVLASNAATRAGDGSCDETSSGGYIRGERYYKNGEVE